MASSKRVSLPSEIIEEILYRTPAESLIRFKSTCKERYNLISNNKRFIYNHLNHSPERFIRIDDNKTAQIMDPVNMIQSDSPIPNEFRVPCPIYTMVHCDGLILCLYDSGMYKNSPRYYNLAVWNPVMRKIKCIKPSFCYWRTDYFGFGYNSTCRDNYKILRFRGPLFELYDYVSDGDDGADKDPECDIYEFKSDSWTSLDAMFDWKVDFECKGVSVKGKMYWLAEKEEDFILSFDFSSETFNDICVCPPPCYLRILGCFNGDRLSLLQQDYHDESIDEIEVWMTNKLNDEFVSFTKYLSVTTPQWRRHCISKGSVDSYKF